MITEKINDFTYRVHLYDWDTRHDDYVAGHLKRDDRHDDSDRYYWRFYPNNDLAPISAGDLRWLSNVIVGLNKNIS